MRSRIPLKKCPMKNSNNGLSNKKRGLGMRTCLMVVLDKRVFG